MVLDASTRDAVVAFATDTELARFRERLEAYRGGVAEDRSSAAYEPFFDAIDDVRRWSPADRISDRLADVIEAADAGDQLLVDVTCWYPELDEMAADWVSDVETATRAQQGEIVDNYINTEASIAMVRVQCQAAVVQEIAMLDVVATIDLIPAPPIWFSEASALGVDDLPTIPPRRNDAVLVGIVDSGVESGHPLLAGHINDAAAFAGLPNGADPVGHGTGVASLVLHGSLEQILATGHVPVPHCSVLSARVFDEHGNFPMSVIWPKELEEAVRHCAREGARVVNLSLGDEGHTFKGGRSTQVASLIDQLVRELDIVAVVAAGNIHPVAYSQGCADLTVDYPQAILDHDGAGILDPAPSALALTVGAAVTKTVSSQPSRRAMGRVGWPSSVTRRGPGVANAVKPELCAAGGTFAVDSANAVVADLDLGCLVAWSGLSGLFSSALGTSLAAPLVARIAAAVFHRYPAASPNLVRALVLQGSDGGGEQFIPQTDGVGEAGVQALQRQLVGYGSARLDESVSSAQNRVVLIAEDEIEVDGVHLYEIPIPSTFFESGGTRGITVSLAFDPEVRATRLDYLASRMKFELVRGLDAETVERLFLAEPENLTEQAAAGDESTGHESDGSPESLSDLSGRQRPALVPSMTARSGGANQLARRTFHQRLRPEDGTSFLLAVQNTNRWAPSGTRQDYAVAVTLWQSTEVEIYAELEVELEAVAEVEIEV